MPASTSSTMLVMTGACGGVTSGAITLASGPVLPAGSVAVTARSSPFRRGVVRIISKLPSGPATPPPITSSPSRTVTVLPASAFPVTVAPSAEI
ncbi:hypothetical protein D3C76_1565200 [compost metagenome]